MERASLVHLGTLAFLVLIGAACSGDKKVAADARALRPASYTHEYFGLEIRAPEGWEFIGIEDSSTPTTPTVAPGEPFFATVKYPVDEEVFNPMILATVQSREENRDLSIASAKDVLTTLSTLLMGDSDSIFTFPDPPYLEEKGGISVARLDGTATIDGRQRPVAYGAIWFSGYSVLVSGRLEHPDDLSVFERFLDELRIDRTNDKVSVRPSQETGEDKRLDLIVELLRGVDGYRIETLKNELVAVGYTVVPDLLAINQVYGSIQEELNRQSAEAAMLAPLPEGNPGDRYETDYSFLQRRKWDTEVMEPIRVEMRRTRNILSTAQGALQEIRSRTYTLPAASTRIATRRLEILEKTILETPASSPDLDGLKRQYRKLRKECQSADPPAMRVYSESNSVYRMVDSDGDVVLYTEKYIDSLRPEPEHIMVPVSWVGTY